MNTTIKDSLNDNAEIKGLTEQETRTILTPFAFKIDQSLFGLSLAKPYKRAIALAIDLLLIALLSEAPGELLAVVIAITLFRLGKKGANQTELLNETSSTALDSQNNADHNEQNKALKQPKLKGRKRRAILRGFGVFIVFVLLLDALPSLFNYLGNEQGSQAISTGKNKTSNDDDGIKINSVQSAIELTALGFGIRSIVEDSSCRTYLCWSQLFGKYVNKDFADDDLSLSNQDINKLINSAVVKTNLTEQEKSKLTAELYGKYQALKQKIAKSEPETKMLAAKGASTEKEREQNNLATNNLSPNKLATKEFKSDDGNADNSYSIMAWVKGIINDLGLGFGWSAFYFTVLTAFWHGQTIGKKILSIRVLQLDGTPLTLWDSFGRYGGYGAGLATGLLGFIQIFWDANRQAIHDKISATVVIDIADNKKG